MNVHLDTHVAVWLVAGERRRLRPVQARIRRSALFLSPVALLELEFLREIGRLRGPVSEVWKILNEDYGVRLADAELGGLCGQARQLSWTRDPFDRLIAAQAMLADALLLTADESMLARCPVAHWD